MKLSRASIVVLCLTIGVACVWAAQTTPTPATSAPATAPAGTPAAAAPATTPAPVTPKSEFKNDQEKLSYAIGFRLGTNLKTQETALDLPTLFKAMTDVLNGQPLAMDEQEVGKVIDAWQMDVRTKMEAKRKEQAEKNLVEGKAFLEANAKKEGIKVLPSGLQYKVVKEGTGNIPAATDRVKVQYKGALTNGTEFDSSYKRGQPAEFQVGGVIKGWVEALQLMKEGSKWELYIPPTLAYGEAARPSIPPNSVLIFEVELLEIVKPAAAAPAPGATVITPNAAAPAGGAAATKPEVKPQAKPQ